MLESRNLGTYLPYQHQLGRSPRSLVLSLCRGLIDPEFLYQITASQAIKFRSTDSPLLSPLVVPPPPRSPNIYGLAASFSEAEAFS